MRAKLFLCVLLVTFTTFTATAENQSLVKNPDKWDQMHFFAAFGSTWDSAFVPQAKSVNVRDKYGNTPLMIAAIYNNCETFIALLDLGADLTRFNRKDGLVQHYLGYFDSANRKILFPLLQKRGININQPNQSNVTLLHLAVRSGDLSLIDDVLAYSTDLPGTINLKAIDHDFNAPVNMVDHINYRSTDFSPAVAFPPGIEKTIINRLVSHGSEAYRPLPMTMGYLGNFFFSGVTIAHELNLMKNIFAQPSLISAPYGYTVMNDWRQEFYMPLRGLEFYLKDSGYPVKLKHYTDNFTAAYRYGSKSKKRCFLLANMGNHPLVTQYWVILAEVTNEELEHGLIDSIGTDRFMETLQYRFSDISEIILVESSF